MGVGVEALLGKKCCARLAIGVGGGDSESRDPNTNESSGDWMVTLIVAVNIDLLDVDGGNRRKWIDMLCYVAVLSSYDDCMMCGLW